MSEVVERAARAAYERWHEQQNIGLDPRVARTRFVAWDDLYPWDRAMQIEAQRAAIEAMREPTDAMIDAVAATVAADVPKDAEITETASQYLRFLCAEQWRTAVDAALK